MQTLQKQLVPMALATTFLAGTAMTEPVLAASLTFQTTDTAKLELFDRSGQQVGSGQFTYQPFVGSFVSTIQSGAIYESPTDPIPAGPSVLSRYTPPDAFHLVTNLAVDLFTVGYSLNNSSSFTQTGQSLINRSVFFWKPTDVAVVAPGSANVLLEVGGGDGRNPYFLGSSDSWTDCFPLCGTFQQDVYAFNPNGTWSFLAAPRGNNPPVSIGGTWKATAVPEPTTVAGALLAIAGYVAQKRQKHRKL